MPTGPDDPNAAAVAEWADTVKTSADTCRKLETAGWKPRWCDNPGDSFVEIAYEKCFAEEVDALIDLDNIGVRLDFVWEEA
jgi:LPS sulfotransferase NodH